MSEESKSEYWQFSFILSAIDGSDAIPTKTADDLMDAIIDFAESRGLAVPGHYRGMTESELESEPSIPDLAMLVRRLAAKLAKASPGDDLLAKALDYLTRAGLNGSPLR